MPQGSKTVLTIADIDYIHMCIPILEESVTWVRRVSAHRGRRQCMLSQHVVHTYSSSHTVGGHRKAMDDSKGCHLSVVIDLSPSQWHVSAQGPPVNPHPLPLNTCLAQLLAFLNAQIASKHENTLAVFGAFPRKRSAPWFNGSLAIELIALV